MKKILALGIAGLLIIALLAMITAMNVNRLAQAFSTRGVQAIQGQTVNGIHIERLDLPEPQIHIADLSISWPRLTAQVTMTEENEFLSGDTITLQMDALQVTMDGILSHTLMVSANAISATVQDKEPENKQSLSDGITRLDDGSIRLTAQLDLWPPGEIKSKAKNVVHNLMGLLRTGSTTIPVTLSGITSFRVNKEVVTAKLSVQQNDTSYRLTMDQESLRIISWIMTEKLTDPEIELLSLNPIKAPRLLHIRNDAQESARLAHEAHTVIPEDAYRHVLWSYLLTQAYGEHFATAVTDAHEQGKTDNSPAEHQMDYINNAVGRTYAAQHYTRDELIDRLLSDPAVIREAGTNNKDAR